MAPQVDPFQSWSGLFGQLAAIAGHRVSAERLASIRASGTPLLVVGATQDNLINLGTGTVALRRALAPRQCLVLESGHGVNVERSAEVNAAMMDLLQAAEQGERGASQTARM